MEKHEKNNTFKIISKTKQFEPISNFRNTKQRVHILNIRDVYPLISQSILFSKTSFIDIRCVFEFTTFHKLFTNTDLHILDENIYIL